MKIIVTHLSPDWDAIGGVWIIRRFLKGWENASVEFVPAGGRSVRVKDLPVDDTIQVVGHDEIIHVDTGLGPLDHHQTSDTTQSGTGRAWEYVQEQRHTSGQYLKDSQEAAVSKVVKFIVDTDHFKEVFWPDAANERYEFTILGLLEGMKYMKPEQHEYYVAWGMEILDALAYTFENRLWAEREIAQKGVEFETKYGKGIAFETENDTVLKLAQKMGYTLVVRKDTDHGYVRIKVLPAQSKEKDIDLTPVYEAVTKADPKSTWYLHISKKMLLNGSSKNPNSISTKLKVPDLIEILEKVYK
jgi:hypothetical protein